MIQNFLRHLHTPAPDSHKGQNGKALIIGGSDLFHAASRWSFLAASRLTDMTFYSSVSENNQLLYDAKFYAHDGVIVPRRELPQYIQEVDSILIGPGMRRDVATRFSPEELNSLTEKDLTEFDWENDTQAVARVVTVLGKDKKWVIDAGALQVMQPEWIPPRAVITPHSGELERLVSKMADEWQVFFAQFLSNERQSTLRSHLNAETSADFSMPPQVVSETSITPQEKEILVNFSAQCNNAVFLLKGPVDIIWNADQLVVVTGGNAGLTKGGTGDVLAGSLVGFLATSEPFTSAVVASYLNKLAGHLLFEKKETMFNSSDLVEMLPTAWQMVKESPLGL